jgi:TolB protein
LSLATLAVVGVALAACDPSSPLDPTGQDSAAPAPAAEAIGTLVSTTRIAYASYHNGQYDIYRMSATGQNVTPVATSTTTEQEPAWSADNKRIALIRYRTSAANQTRRDVYIVNADGTNGHWARSQTCACDLGHPSWSPDGSRLAVTMTLNGTNYVAYLILATGQLGAYSTSYGGLPGSWPTYTKTGQIVYVGPTGKTVFRMSGSGTNIKTLFTSPNYLAEPALSPDGNKLLYVQAIDLVTLNSDIYLRNLTTGATKMIAPSSASEGFPSWSADGTRIAFASGRSGVAQIYTTDASGGNLTRITHTTTAESEPVWSR